MTSSETAAQTTTGPRRRAPLAWKRRGYRQLTRAWVFSNLADSVLFLMMAVWVKDLTGSDTQAAIVFISFGLAAFAAPFLGQLADRTARKPLLIAANLLMAPVIASLLFVTAERIWLVYVVIGVYGAIGYLTGSAQSGIIRDLLPDAELASGNGLLSTIDQAARLVAPLIGTGLYVLFGPPAVILVTVASFAVAGVLLLRLEITESAPTPVAEREGYFRELGAGVRQLFGVPELGLLTIVMAIAFAATGLTNVTVFPALEQGFGLDSAWLGPIVTLQGIGALVGGLTAAAVIGRLGERRVIALGSVIAGLGFLPIAGGWFGLAVVGAALLGLSVTWMIVAYVTVRQRRTPARLQGRVSAAANVALNVPQTLAMIAAAAAIVLVDYRWLIIGTSLVLLVAALLCRPFRRADAAASDSVEA